MIIADILINGPAQSGKDTFIKIFEEKNPNLKVANVSSIDPFRTIPISWGWNGVKDESYRKALYYLKKAAIVLNDYPVEFLLEVRGKYVATFEKYVIFYHIREPEEIKKLKEKLPFLQTIFLERDNNKPLSLEEDEINIRKYEYDYYLKAKDLKELKNLIPIIKENSIENPFIFS